VIYLGSFSKLIFPSLRLGYIVAPESLVAPLRTAKLITDQHTATALQEAAATLLTEGHYERHIRRVRRRISRQRAALVQAMACAFGNKVEISGISGGLHAAVWWPSIPAAVSEDIVEKCAAVGVGVYSINVFSLLPQRCAGLILRYASMPERDITAGIHRIADAMRC
jgi:GntR family transcriptional regulator/MocR family aminotransferase